MTFDFSSSCIKIPHNKLLNVMYELINFCFDGGGNAHVAVTIYGAKWISDPSTCFNIFNPKTFKKLLIIY